MMWVVLFLGVAFLAIISPGFRILAFIGVVVLGGGLLWQMHVDNTQAAAWLQRAQTGTAEDAGNWLLVHQDANPNERALVVKRYMELQPKSR
jgi:hypothetical protein